MAGRIAVVDGQNRFVRWTDREEVHARRLTHRTIHVLLLDGAGRLLLQRRHREKRTDAWKWDLSCAGHVEDEDYTGGPDEGLDEACDRAAHREVLEELGVEAELEALARFGPEAGVHYEQIRFYRGLSDGPFRLQADEVEEIVHVTPAELDARVAAGSAGFTSTMRWLTTWARARGVWG